MYKKLTYNICYKFCLFHLHSRQGCGIVKTENISSVWQKQMNWQATPDWYLLDFVLAGEDAGKTLNRLFNPLPDRADYFESRIENMLYDSSTGALNCDYTHFILERTYRLPLEFLEDNCPTDMFCIDGVSLDVA